MATNFIIPDWDTPETIKSLITTRQGGVSDSPYDSFNLAEHVNDKAENVSKNRQILGKCLPSEPVWLNQIHSNKLIDASLVVPDCDADGSYTTKKNIVSVVMTADCLPVLICNRQATGVAAVHAGWRGLVNGILEQGVAKLLQVSHCDASDLMVWLGPAIGPEHFEVGEEVRQEFLQKSRDKNNIASCFIPAKDANKWFADIYQLARARLLQAGVENVSGGNYCTYSDKERFYSYRRDTNTGRMASMIWIK